MEQPAIVQRLSQEAHNADIQSLKHRTMSDQKEDDDVDSESELDLTSKPEEPDLNFEPKTPDDAQSPSTDEINFKPKSPSNDEEKKEDDLDANCKRYDEGSHSESSQMHDDESSSDLPNGKHEDHELVIPEDMESNDNVVPNGNVGAALTEDLEANIDDENENQDLLQKKE